MHRDQSAPVAPAFGRRLLADVDPDDVGIVLLRRADGSLLIVNVKPADRLEDTHVADRWRGRGECAPSAVGAQVWTGAKAQLLAITVGELGSGWSRSVRIAYLLSAPVALAISPPSALVDPGPWAGVIPRWSNT